MQQKIINTLLRILLAKKFTPLMFCPHAFAIPQLSGYKVSSKSGAQKLQS